jgi:ACT domain-containing protein
MKAILSVMGKDRVGIIAGVSQALAGVNINILNVSQTIMDGYFTMVMLCDISQMNQGFDAIKEVLTHTGETLGVQVNIQRQEIFDAMHKL